MGPYNPDAGEKGAQKKIIRMLKEAGAKE